VEPGSAGRERRRELLEVLIERDDLLALHVAAALRPHLILEEAAGGARLDELADRALDVLGAAVAGVGVDDHGIPTGRADAAGRVEDLRLRQQPDVRACETRGRQRVARDEERAEARALREHRAEGVVDAGQQERLAAREHVGDAGRGHWPSIAHRSRPGKVPSRCRSL
jgi:hypothetical protein